MMCRFFFIQRRNRIDTSRCYTTMPISIGNKCRGSFWGKTMRTEFHSNSAYIYNIIIYHIIYPSCYIIELPQWVKVLRVFNSRAANMTIIF